MTERFRALLLTEEGGKPKPEFTELTVADLPAGDVRVRVTHSTVNYKDGLAITGTLPVVRAWPMVPGIDFSGVVLESSHPGFQPGDRVVQNGYGLSEVHWGGYAGQARVKGDWLVKLPESIDNVRAMAIGTAGYTAMLAVLALERGGITPDKGDVLVTGAAGGVGSVAIAILSKLGYRVVASTGRPAETAYLKDLGAAEVIDRSELSGKPVPLGSERWAGAVDSVGSTTLANVLSTLKYDGAVAACGLAQGADLPATVIPFLLRGATLYGIDSVQRPMRHRVEAWKRLATDLPLDKLDATTTHAPLDAVVDLAHSILKGQVRGRVVIDIAG